jgi:Xaa-Pro dipeptidase
MFDLPAMRAALLEFGFDGWLLHDFRGSNVLARRILELDGKPTTSRRFYYFVPAEGEPIRLVHRIETGVLDHLPGEKRVYLRWQDLEQSLRSLVAGRRRVAMEYSPRNNIPYISRTDAGTIEVIREAGVEVVSSGDLIQRFEATWGDEQWAMHREAQLDCHRLNDGAIDQLVSGRGRRGGNVPVALCHL